MAWNRSPEVAVARDAGKKLGTLAGGTTDQCIIFYGTSDGRFGYASYGRTRDLCNDSKRLADAMYACAMGETRPGMVSFDCPECHAIETFLAERDGLEDGDAPLHVKIEGLVLGLQQMITHLTRLNSQNQRPENVQGNVSAATVLMP